ncbi:hypothetical protein [Erwinia amylovora]
MCIRDRQKGGLKAPFCCAQTGLGSNPVSYTHLDVYKRQAERRPESAFLLCANRAGFEPCLLYTSRCV